MPLKIYKRISVASYFHVQWDPILYFGWGMIPESLALALCQTSQPPERISERKPSWLSVIYDLLVYYNKLNKIICWFCLGNHLYNIEVHPTEHISFRSICQSVKDERLKCANIRIWFQFCKHKHFDCHSNILDRICHELHLKLEIKYELRWTFLPTWKFLLI